MQKTAGEPTVVLAPPRFLVGPVFQLMHKVSIVEGHERNEAGKADDDVGDGHCIVFRVSYFVYRGACFGF